MFSTNILSSKTVFNIDNNKKKFLSTKLANYNDFWTIGEDCNSCLKYSFSNIGINYISNYIKIEFIYFK